MTTSAQIEAATGYGLVNVTTLAEAADLVGIPFPAACALMEKESGGRNIYGHDQGGAGPAGQPVTRTNFEAFLAKVLAGATSNGVGPSQITYAGPLVNGRRDGGFFRIMAEQGLRPWVVADNMRFGLDLLWGYYQSSFSWVTAGERYNGARSYGDALAVKVQEWERRLDLEEDMPLSDDDIERIARAVWRHEIPTAKGEQRPAQLVVRWAAERAKSVLDLIRGDTGQEPPPDPKS